MSIKCGENDLKLQNRCIQVNDYQTMYVKIRKEPIFKKNATFHGQKGSRGRYPALYLYLPSLLRHVFVHVSSGYGCLVLPRVQNIFRFGFSFLRQGNITGIA